jgi:peptidyl-prolyl cis-trans isomerase SurA
MKLKYTLLCFFIVQCMANALAQNGVIATIGKQQILTDEFLWAFNKNNKSDKVKADAIKEYLDLHINYKLKVLEAFKLKLDTFPEKKMELAQLYASMAEKYINEENIYSQVVKETFARLQTERVVKHIYIAISNFKNKDTIDAKNKIANEVLAKLNKKENFEKLAAQYSEDASSKNNGGLIGTVNALTLPYELENIVYGLKVGSYSNIITSKTGLHIFYVSAERKSTGNIYAKQILLANQINTGVTLSVLANSIHKQLEANPLMFDSLVKVFSNDQTSNALNGIMQPFTLGVNDVRFENGVLDKTKKQMFNVFESDLGWHITKLDSIIPFPSTLTVAVTDSLVNVVKQQDRGLIAKDIYIKAMLPKLGYIQNPAATNDVLLKMASNITESKSTYTGLPANLDASTTMHSFTKLKVKLGDWESYYKSFVANSNVPKNVSKQLEAYITATAKEYYQTNYADYNKDFKYLMNEFREGNIYFDFMQSSLWNKISEDTIGVKNYYNQNKKNYVWKPSLSGVVITAAEEGIVKEIYAALQKNSNLNLNDFISKYDDKVRLDSGRFELENITTQKPSSLSANQITKPEKLAADSWYTIIKIVKVFNNTEPRNYDDAKGFAANDYAVIKEMELINKLKKDYPVLINNAELKKISQ